MTNEKRISFVVTFKDNEWTIDEADTKDAFPDGQVFIGEEPVLHADHQEFIDDTEYDLQKRLAVAPFKVGDSVSTLYEPGAKRKIAVIATTYLLDGLGVPYMADELTR